MFRIRLVLGLLGRPPAGSAVLDIGSGQGEFALHLAELYPDLSVWGVEYSQHGVDLSRAAAQAKGASARFVQRDLLRPAALDPDQPAAGFAVCSEVLEHVDDQALLLRNASSLLAPGCRVVITVPGGPRSAFDLSIGHVRHFTADALRTVISDAGLTVECIRRAGFPFFNLYKLVLVARGKRLITDVGNPAPDRKPSLPESAATRFFDTAFRYTTADFPLGWQMAAVARVPDSAT